MREDEGVVVPGVGGENPVRSSAKYGFLGWGLCPAIGDGKPNPKSLGLQRGLRLGYRG
jgi:hypothetical protein